ncbi:hypothetical protein HaLaN_17938 [Haematococcus lacustris]|uniref:Uncharacterized protein n=1 Tax=Haematococcus lacustris TaxID=44745 RepID=A0A699ZPW7_HAELA|nr:hypothetical protein HaLaN_17938 [Haematococcus lacustris]
MEALVRDKGAEAGTRHLHRISQQMGTFKLKLARCSLSLRLPSAHSPGLALDYGSLGSLEKALRGWLEHGSLTQELGNIAATGGGGSSKDWGSSWVPIADLWPAA